jgi:SPP1 gp7 family putative phage head morphogenesis protein
MNRLAAELEARLLREPTVFQATRIQSLLADIEAITKSAYNRAQKNVVNSAVDLAESEAGITTKVYSRASIVDFTLPSTEQLVIAVERAPMVPLGNGVSQVNLVDAFSKFSDAKSKSSQQLILDRMALGDTTQQIAKALSSKIKTLDRRQLTALVKTATNHASSVARNAVYVQNARLLDGYEWLSTLDNKTTLVCGARDGQVYQVGTGPMPPAHFNCRSTTIPRVSKKYSANVPGGGRPSVGPDGAAEQSAATGYGGWLRKQPKEFIDEALGPERSALFRNGGYNMDRFTDPTGRTYTLKELASQDALVLQ